MAKLKGLATGAGSFPYRDAETALDLIFQSCPQIPFWPQLPKRDIREGMIAQFSENLPQDNEELEKFYEHIVANDIDYFKISHESAAGLHKFYQRLEKSNLKDIEFIKCQITGPFTFSASMKDSKDIALLHDAVFFQAILKGLAMKALWQIKLFKKFGKKIIMFIDEPYLAALGSGYTPINREEVIKGLSELSSAIKESGDSLVGVHCCGNTDWSIFTDVPAIDIINFDAFGFLERFVLYADNLKSFLSRPGIICWGIVPTQEFSGKETPELLIGKIKSGIEALAKKGVDKDLLVNNLLISPACGLGTLDTAKSEQIFKLLSDTSALIRKSL